MDQLWAPWRLAYVASAKATAVPDPCFICRGLNDSDNRANLIVLRTARSVVLLNRFPYNNGHLLIAPRSHIGRLELTSEELLETMETLRPVRVLEDLMCADGFNIGLNLGKVAGEGLPGHVHWHVVPRWSGDTNFMPVLADVKVIVQSLDALYDLLAPQIALLRMHTVDSAFTPPDWLDRENDVLAPYAMHTRWSRGRRHPEEPHAFRTLYPRRPRPHRPLDRLPAPDAQDPGACHANERPSPHPADPVGCRSNPDCPHHRPATRAQRGP